MAEVMDAETEGLSDEKHSGELATLELHASCDLCFGTSEQTAIGHFHWPFSTAQKSCFDSCDWRVLLVFLVILGWLSRQIIVHVTSVAILTQVAIWLKWSCVASLRPQLLLLPRSLFLVCLMNPVRLSQQTTQPTTLPPSQLQ